MRNSVGGGDSHPLVLPAWEVLPEAWHHVCLELPIVGYSGEVYHPGTTGSIGKSQSLQGAIELRRVVVLSHRRTLGVPPGALAVCPIWTEVKGAGKAAGRG